MTKLEELVAKLSELFELDKADLDFGIHRIIKAKHAQITTYLKERLPEKVKTVLGELLQAETGESLAELEREALNALGGDAILADGTLAPVYANTPLGECYNAAVEVARSSRSRAQAEAEVYSHLYEFFSRYYEAGDVISRRCRTAGRETYAIPYDGEEVVLHWANKDQYYVKSSEDLKDYTFTVLLNPSGDKGHVQFKLTRMDAVQNNNKASRIFLLDSEAGIEAGDESLVIPFHFAEGKSRKQADELAWEKSILAALPLEWQARLAVQDSSYTGNDERNILQKHLRNYTRKNTSDYFIHKDLGGFLRRELDFYIKNEVMHLDDVDDRPAGYLDTELRKIKAIRAVAHDLVAFLAQFEDFQKRLWLKKKFVVETNWCITLDRIPEEFYPEIAANDAQRQEWVRLFAIDEIEATPGGLLAPAKPGYSEPLTVEFLMANDKLVLDTAFFSAEFKTRLIASIDGIDTQMDGLLIHSENFQALNLMQERYREQMNAVYIDPPYNTGEGGFIYKDAYKHSSWLALMRDRMYLAMALQRHDSAIYASINEDELYNFKFALDDVYGSMQYLSTFAVKVRHENRILKGDKDFHEVFENVLAYRKTNAHLPAKRREDNTSLDDYVWKVTVDAPHKVISMDGKSVEVFTEGNYILEKCEPSNELLKRINIRGTLREGNSSGRFFVANLEMLKDQFPNALFRVPNIGNDGLGHRYFWLPGAGGKRRNGDYFQGVPVDKEDTKEVPYANLWDFERDFNQCADEGGIVFRNGKKPIAFLKHILTLAGVAQNTNSNVLDFFAGSGSTAHAIIDLNRDDNGTRRYVLIEMDDYFDTVLKPRIQKAVYSNDWKKGKPTSRDTGVSHCFKYLRLESYEDTLNNLALVDRSADILGLPEQVQDDCLLRYSLDVESRASLLDLTRFENPFACMLKVYNRGVGEAEPRLIDLPETFNCLLGLRVRTMRMLDGFLVIEGENPAAETVLVIWRNVKEKDNVALEAFITGALRINPAETEYAAVYINGDATLDDPHGKFLLTEQVFYELMFDVRDYKGKNCEWT